MVPILGFVLCITVVAELADRAGVFRALAARLAALAGGSVLRLWLLVAGLATLSTAVLSLDTTAVLLTPVVLATAAQLGLNPALFAYTTVWLANTASLVLPVSNLTNLLAVHRLGAGFVAVMWPAAGASVLVTLVALAVLFRSSLRGRYPAMSVAATADRPLLALAGLVCALLGPLFAVGVDITYASAVAALVLVLGFLVRAPRHLSIRLVPWPLILGVSVLFVVVQFAHDHSALDAVLRDVAGASGGGWSDLLGLGAVAAAGANVVNNLPCYLALEPLAAQAPIRLAALLVGVNTGPLVTPWASLATLLWAGRCRAAGLDVDWGRFALRGLVLVPVLLLVDTTALVLAH